MSFYPPPPGPVMPASGVIENDVQCVKCGYNLRTLSMLGRCPECGTPVGLSLHGNLLRYADPQWVETLARGINLILWGILAAICGGIIGAIVAKDNPIVGQMIGLLGSGVGLAGAWLITTPDPSGLGEEQYATPRKVTRVCLLLGLMYNLAEMGLQGQMLSGGGFYMLVLVAIAAGLAQAVGTIAELLYFSKLAMRVPDPQMASRARAIMWGYGMPIALLAVVGGIIYLSMPQLGRGSPGSAGGPLIAFGCVGGLAALVMLVFGIMYLILLFRMNRVLRDQAALARSTWAANVGPQG